jgi:hypothetical protein
MKYSIYLYVVVRRCVKQVAQVAECICPMIAEAAAMMTKMFKNMNFLECHNF